MKHSFAETLCQVSLVLLDDFPGHRHPQAYTFCNALSPKERRKISCLERVTAANCVLDRVQLDYIHWEFIFLTAAISSNDARPCYDKLGVFA